MATGLSEGAKEGLKDLGVPSFLIEEADRRACRGGPDLRPSPDLLERIMERVGPKLKKVGFEDLQLEKGGDKGGISPGCVTEGDKIGLEKGGSQGKEQTDKGGISPSLEKGFEPKLEKKGAKSGFSGGGTGN